MKVSDILNRVRISAGDPEAVQFADTDILAWINDAMRECASDNNLLQKKGTTPLVIGQRGYSLPSDILKLHSVQYNHVDIPVYTLDEAQTRQLLTAVEGEPHACWIWAGNVELYPTPNIDGEIEINYTREPVLVEGESDTPEIGTMYHMRIVDYCLAQVAQQDDDMNRYQLKMEEFRTGIQTLKDQPEWTDDQYPFMTVSPRDMGDTYYDEY